MKLKTNKVQFQGFNWFPIFFSIHHMTVEVLRSGCTQRLRNPRMHTQVYGEHIHEHRTRVLRADLCPLPARRPCGADGRTLTPWTKRREKSASTRPRHQSSTYSLAQSRSQLPPRPKIWRLFFTPITNKRDVYQ